MQGCGVSSWIWPFPQHKNLNCVYTYKWGQNISFPHQNQEILYLLPSLNSTAPNVQKYVSQATRKNKSKQDNSYVKQLSIVKDNIKLLYTFYNWHDVNHRNVIHTFIYDIVEMTSTYSLSCYFLSLLFVFKTCMNAILTKIEFMATK